MKHSQVSVRGMKSASHCYETIDNIWNDHYNIVGGISTFMSGYTTHLTTAAKKKVEALERKAMTFISEDDE